MAQGKLLPCVGPIDWGKDVANGVFDRACKEGTFFSRLPDIWAGGCFLRRPFISCLILWNKCMFDTWYIFFDDASNFFTRIIWVSQNNDSSFFCCMTNLFYNFVINR